MVVAAFGAIIGPYVIGWVRSFLAVAGSAVALLGLQRLMSDEPVWLLVAASVGAVAAIAALTWFSLRFGHVWRPADARQPGAARSTLWPYPYA